MRKIILSFCCASSLAIVESQARAESSTPEMTANVRRQIAQRLDPEASLYGYSVFAGELSRTLDDLTRRMAIAVGDNAEDRVFKQDYTALATELGLTQVTGFGYSSTPRSGGYENRTFFSVEGPRRGLLAVFGGAPHAFDTLRFAPKDTDLFLEMDLDLPAALRSVAAVLKRIDPAKAAELDLDTPTTDTPKPWQVLAGFHGRTTLVARVNIGKNGSLTSEDLLNLVKNETPADVFVRIEGLATRLKPWLDQSKFATRQAKGRTLYLPLHSEDSPVWARQAVLTLDGDTFVAASSEVFLNECLNRREGLDQDSALKSALAALGNQGNSLTYASPALFKVIRQALEWSQAMFMFRQASNPLLQHMTERFPQPNEPVMSVTANLPEGIYSRSWTPQNLQIAAVALNLLSPEIGGQMVSEAVATAQRQNAKTREAARARETIEKNLAEIDAAARRYFSAHADATEVAWSELSAAEPKIAEIKPSAGEDYSALTIKRASDKLSVSTNDYTDVTYVRPLTEAEKTEIRRRLTLIDRAAAQHFATNPDSSSFSASHALTLEPELKDLSSIAGEDYSLYINREAKTLEVQTEGGQQVTIERDPSLLLKALKDHLRTETKLLRELTPAFTAIQASLAKGDREWMTLGTAIEEKIVAKPESLSEEELGAVVVTKDQYRVTVKHSGRELSLLFPLEAAKRAQAQNNAQQIAKAAADYFRKHPDEDVVLVGELAAGGANSSLKPVAGENLDTIAVHRTDTVVALALPTGHTVSAPLNIAR